MGQIFVLITLSGILVDYLLQKQLTDRIMPTLHFSLDHEKRSKFRIRVDRTLLGFFFSV